LVIICNKKAKINLFKASSFVAAMASTSRVLESNTQDITSIHAGLIEEVHDIPMGVLIRPFPLEVNDDKVCSIMKTLQVSSIYELHPTC
jgi:sulfiredoxin